MNIVVSKFYPIIYKKQETVEKDTCLNKHSDSISRPSFLGYSVASRTEIQLKKMSEEQFFEAFLFKNGKVTKEEYEDIKKNHPYTLIQAQYYCEQNYGGKMTPYELAMNALRADEYFKNNYKNYRIISLGTSPSPIAEQLMNMGHEVVFLPASGVRNFYKNKKHTLGNVAQLRALMQYLDTKNIDDGKLNLVLDFTSSGQTLTTVVKFIKEYFKFNNKHIDKISVDDCILDKYYDKIRNYCITDMISSRIEQISNVPHYPIFNESKVIFEEDDDNTVFFDLNTPKSEIFEEIDNYSTPLARAFALCTMAEIDRIQSLKMENSDEN